jgi:hypothetical protein
MSTTTTPAASNVVPLNQATPPVWPMPPGWPTPNYPAGNSPWPQPPSCFSELAALNSCYNSIQMMEMILQKVICDMAANNPAFQKCLVDAIAASGSNVPLIGVTNGSDAQPGQVGEYIYTQTTLNLPAVASGATGTIVVPGVVVQPGDWDAGCFFLPTSSIQSVVFQLNPVPVGVSNWMMGEAWSGTTEDIQQVMGQPARILISVPTLMPFTITYGTALAQTAIFGFYTRRAR